MRRERLARRWTVVVSAGAGITVVGELGLTASPIDDPTLHTCLWLGWLVVVGASELVLLAYASDARASARAWRSAYRELTAPARRRAPAAEDEPEASENTAGDATLELFWDPLRDIATVFWDGVEVGRWAPEADAADGERGRGWHLIHPRQMLAGHLDTDHFFEPTLRHLARLRVDHHHYLLSEDNHLLLDAKGCQWSLTPLTRGRPAHATGRLPRSLGPDGAIFALRACRQLRMLRDGRSSSSF